MLCHSCWKQCCHYGPEVKGCRLPRTCFRGVSRNSLLMSVCCLWKLCSVFWQISELCCAIDANVLMTTFLRSPWTLAVCLVLLPPLRQLLTTQTHKRYGIRAAGIVIYYNCRIVTVAGDTVLMIIFRFSELILSCRSE